MRQLSSTCYPLCIRHPHLTSCLGAIDSENPPMSTPLKLSICITTLNRAKFIGPSLESMLSQITDDCEIIVLDAASTDETERVVSEYASRSDRLRYIRQSTNNGWD